MGSWSDHVKSWTEQKELPLIIIKYEQLLDNAMSILNNLLKETRLLTDIEVFEKAIEATTFQNLKQLEEAYGFPEKPIQAISFFREGKKDIYKEHLNIEQINEIVEHHGVVMKRLGYLKNLE